MHVVNCYNCGTRENTAYSSENGYHLVKCCRCGLLYVNPRPDEKEIEEALRYGMHGGEQTLKSTGWFHPEKIGEYRKVLRDLYPHGLSDSTHSWLDIGCGHGEFLLALKDFGSGTIQATGVEPNEHKQNSARGRGLNVQFFDLTSHHVKYDTVSLLNVYSHLPDPPETLSAWKHLLKPGGKILLQTGDTANFPASAHYRPFYLPDHLSFASESILRNILERTGFEIETVRKYPFVRPSFISYARESVKVCWPGKKSKLRYLFKRGKYMTDMYLLAKLQT